MNLSTVQKTDLQQLEFTILDLSEKPDMVVIEFRGRETLYTGPQTRAEEVSDAILTTEYGGKKVKLRIVSPDTFGIALTCVNEAVRLFGELKKEIIHDANSPDFQKRMLARIRFKKNFPNEDIPQLTEVTKVPKAME